MMHSTASPLNEVSNAHQGAGGDEPHNDISPDQSAHDGQKSGTSPAAVPNGVNGHATSPRNGEPGTPVTSNDAKVDAKGHDDNENERPAKRQRRDRTPSNPIRKSKLESPPWKKVSAEGPTSYTEDGRRKSGRINTVPIEHQSGGKKRLTRRAIQDTKNTSATQRPATPIKNESKTPQSNARRNSIKRNGHARTTSESTPRSTTRRAVAEPKPPSRSSRRRSPSPPAQPRRQSGRPRRSSRVNNESELDKLGRSPKIRLRVTRSGVIPLVHPGQVPKRPKIGLSFEEYWHRAPNIPLEEGGYFSTEDEPLYTAADALRDAQSIIRIEREVQPGGLLSQDRCSLFVPSGAEEPPRQYARQDHMARAVFNFRRLMVAEHHRHRAMAKRVAEACRDEWIRRQPKSAEQIEAEEKEKWRARYFVVVRALIGTWENVRLEVNRRRLEAWEAEEQKRVKAALNEAVSLSEQKLQARREGLDSELVSEDDGFDDLSDEMVEDTSVMEGDASGLNDVDDSGEDADSDDDSDNMSTSGDEDDMDDGKDPGDENLTQEQLQAKYATIASPAMSSTPEDSAATPGPSEPAKPAERTDAETSDESVDMDDDMGSSDETDSSDDEMELESDSDPSDAEGSGSLLGMFFGKAELKDLKQTATGEELHNREEQVSDTTAREIVTPGEEALDLDGAIDENEVSLVQHPDNVSELSNAPPSSDEAQQAQSRPDAQPIAPEPDEKPENIKHATSEQPNSTDPLEPANDAPSGPADTSLKPDNVIADKILNGTAEAELPLNGDRNDDVVSTGPTSTPQELESQANEAVSDVVETSAATSRAVSTPAQKEHKTEIPFLLRGTLREYQHDGLDWLAGLYANNTNGILADEMGLGKTIQTIALLAHLASYHEVWGPHLVVVPTSVMLNWEMEFKKWCPGFKILAYYGTQEERKRKRQGWNNDDIWNVCITSYQLVLQDQQVFKRRRWHYLILDEAHNIKNFKSQRWQTLLGFNTQARLLLTGTPLQNNLTELWSLLFFLMPAENGVGGFADLQEFHDWFHKPETQILESGREQMDDEARAIISKLHKVLRPYLLRRLKADVEKQMPAKYEHVEFCRLSKRQRELYDGFLARADTKQTLSGGNYLSIINCLMQLRKVCNHPDLFVDRPIMTSFKMSRSVVAEYEYTERRVQSLVAEPLMTTVDVGFLNLIPTRYETMSSLTADSVARLSSHRALGGMREAQRTRAQASSTELDPSTVGSSIGYLESAARWGRFEELQHCVYLNALRRQQRPIYGKNLVDLLTIGTNSRPQKPRPKAPQKLMAWFEEDSTLLRAACPSLPQRADQLKITIEKFSCVTPAVITRDLEQFILGRRGVQAFTDEDLRLSAPVRWAPFIPKEPPLDPWHEARMRLTIQFPDKRLLQYDCGKLQALDKLLRKLQSGGHRALIFTQMTKVLDILEQFLNIHGHKYLRLDGATKVEQRQILTDRFNHDPRILCFILSTRSGGLGINLTGADTVIFYDQDWNPAMDKQCQDRCHRIGQTRDVHIYRLISEHTIEANILRKASQKQMLDDVVIQEGEFTTDHFNKTSVQDALTEKLNSAGEGMSAADAALDRVLGGPDNSSSTQRTVGRVLEQAEDKEDVTAARAAEKEIQADDADFTEKPSNPASGASTTRQGTPAVKSVLDGGLDAALEVDEDIEVNAWGQRMGNVDDFMLSFLTELLKHTKLELPKDKKKGKKRGKDTRKR